jgi:hypothetical protein
MVSRDDVVKIMKLLVILPDNVTSVVGTKSAQFALPAML